MNKLIRNKFFLTGVFLGIVIFAALNISFVGGMRADHPPITEISYGFPFKCCSLIYQKYMATFRNDVPSETIISYPYLFLDLMLGILFSLSLGGLFKFIIYNEKS